MNKMRGKAIKSVPWVLVLAFTAAWVVLLRPDSLGGSARYIVVAGESMEPTLKNGDLAVTYVRSEYRVGDVVAFPIEGAVVIHRIAGGTAEKGFRTRGDGKHTNDWWLVPDQDIKGSLWFSIPRGGVYISNLLSYLRRPVFRGILAGCVVVLALGDVFRRARRGRLDFHDRRRKYFSRS